MDSDVVETILASYEGKRSDLLPILRQIQDKFSYLPECTMLRVSGFLNIPESQVFAVASFYSQFRMTPVGRKRVEVCRGTACHVRGAARVLERAEEALGIKENETSSNMEYSLETVGCVGACALAPVVRINGELQGEVTAKKLKDLFPTGGKGEPGA